MNTAPELLELFDDLPRAKRKLLRDRDGTSGTFTPNNKLAVHRWYRYSAGFSAQWVSDVIAEHASARNILDPFVGSGTVLIEAEKQGRHAIGAESHPLVSRIAESKLAWRTDAGAFSRLVCDVLTDANELLPNARLPQSGLVDKCFVAEAQNELASISQALARRSTNKDGAWRLAWLAFLAVIRESSHVGTAQWQYVLPKKRKLHVVRPLDGFRAKTALFLEDITTMQPFAQNPAAKVVGTDVRQIEAVPRGWADLVITSPPYANNYDYADATRLELAVLGEIHSWGDLQTYIRPHLVRACTQHVAADGAMLDETISSPLLAPIRNELGHVARELAVVREGKGGKKPYHIMLACYFLDMAAVLWRLRSQVKDGGSMCFVVGDSAPYGVHAPVEKWLGALALNAGFKGFRFEKIRDRNTKWKNRKHRVPLHEGRLWIDG